VAIVVHRRRCGMMIAVVIPMTAREELTLRIGMMKGTIETQSETRSADEVRSEIERLTEEDFDPWNRMARGKQRLRDLCREIALLPTRDAAPMIVGFIERFATPTKFDARYDLGTPGPLVRTLESLPGYESFLVESVKRRPAPLTIWMVNRILHESRGTARYQVFLSVLRGVLDHPTAPAEIKEEVLSCLWMQSERP
jgi:hypothetical protein